MAYASGFNLCSPRILPPLTPLLRLFGQAVPEDRPNAIEADEDDECADGGHGEDTYARASEIVRQKWARQLAGCSNENQRQVFPPRRGIVSDRPHKCRVSSGYEHCA